MNELFTKLQEVVHSIDEHRNSIKLHQESLERLDKEFQETIVKIRDYGNSEKSETE